MRYSSPTANSASVAPSSSSSSSSLSQGAGPSSIGSSTSSVDEGETHCFCASETSGTTAICFCVTNEACSVEEAGDTSNNTTRWTDSWTVCYKHKCSCCCCQRQYICDIRHSHSVSIFTEQFDILLCSTCGLLYCKSLSNRLVLSQCKHASRPSLFKRVTTFPKQQRMVTRTCRLELHGWGCEEAGTPFEPRSTPSDSSASSVTKVMAG